MDHLNSFWNTFNPKIELNAKKNAMKIEFIILWISYYQFFHYFIRKVMRAGAHTQSHENELCRPSDNDNDFIRSVIERQRLMQQCKSGRFFICFSWSTTSKEKKDRGNCVIDWYFKSIFFSLFRVCMRSTCRIAFCHI